MKKQIPFEDIIALGGVDIVTMSKMDDEEYREYITGDSGLFTDHHGVLREGITSRPIAVYQEQYDILIQELMKLREEAEPKS
jgi:hypothetical protein